MKLAGRHKFVVASVDISESKKKDSYVLKLGLDLNEEFVNGQWQAIMPYRVYWYGSLKTSPGRQGKSAAQVTAETLKSVFNFTGTKFNDLIFGRGECICEDHQLGDFTRVSAIYPENSKPASVTVNEIPSDTMAEISRIFGGGA